MLRCEFEFDGIVMTDWVTFSDILSADAKYPAPEAYKVALAGNDLFMPGSQQEIDNLTAALKNGHITREELIKKPSGSAGWLWNSQALQFDRPFCLFPVLERCDTVLLFEYILKIGLAGKAEIAADFSQILFSL